MSALARTTQSDCYTREANEDFINGGPRTRTKYTYDSKTRFSTEQITIPGDTSYTYALTYNGTTGLLDTLQYPVSTSGNPLKLQYTYQNGILQQISDVATATHYWTANAMNPRGQLTQETLGNGVQVNRALDAVTGWVSSIQAGVGGGATLQNNSYLFDAVGNLTQRQDNNLGVTENAYPDSLYRLDHTIGDTNTQMTYDAMGRITAWADNGSPANVKDYTTPQPGCTYYANSQLHAVRSNTQSGSSYSPASFCYDANGNMIKATYGSALIKSMTWTSFNQPSDMSGGSSSSQFFYDANHQRYKQIASYSGAPETTFYVGGLLEKMINSSGTAYRHYIPAGNNTIVYTRLSTGTNSTYYLTKDYLGSTAVITDSMGAPLLIGKSEKFAALGWNENSPADQATMATVSRHEFTGHEGIDNAGLWLVNMNGRIYDSSGSMFLSPDPYVPDPGNTQSFNRYSYVNNNPMTFIDPSGFDDTLPDYIVTCCSSSGGGFIGDTVGFFEGLFGGGGGPKDNGPHGIKTSTPLQGAAAFTPVSDGQFKIAFDAVSGTQGPQITGASAADFGMDFNPDAGLESIQTSAAYMNPIAGGGLTPAATDFVAASVTLSGGMGNPYSGLLISFDSALFGPGGTIKGAFKAMGMTALNMFAAGPGVNFAGGPAVFAEGQAARGFGSFSAFKNAMGRAGPGMNWHHIVEQTPGNIEQFGSQTIHNTQNLVRVDAAVHGRISGFYSSIQPFTNDQRVRQWLGTQSFEEQTQFGLDTLRRLGVVP
jgi:RHS repeat-associated protein